MKKTISGRLQKKIVTYSVLGIFLIGLILALASIFPLYNNLKTGEEKNLLFSAKNRSLPVEEYFSRCYDIAVQISNRTAIRQRLESHYRQAENLKGLKTFVQEFLTDSLYGSENLAGITLLDSEGNLLGEVGLSLPLKYRTAVSQNTAPTISRSTIHLYNTFYLLIGVPILDRYATQVGTDLVLFNLGHLQNIIGDYSGLGKTGEILLGVREGGQPRLLFSSKTGRKEIRQNISDDSRLREGFQRAFQKETGIIPSSYLTQGQEVMAFAPIRNTDWVIIVKMDGQELYGPIRSQIAVIGTSTLALILLCSLGMVFLLRPLAGKMIIHTDELEKQIQEKTLTLRRELNERRKAEASAEKERKRLFTLLDGLPASVYLQAPDYTIRYANRYFLEYFGDPKEKFCFQIFKGFDQPCRECPTFRVFETREPQVWEGSRKGGKTYRIYNYFFSETDGSSLVMELGIDITELKEKEEELKESRNLLEKILSNLDEAVIVTDPQRVLYDCNKTAEEIFGYSREEMVGRNIQFLHASEQLYHRFGQEAQQNYQDKGFYKTEHTMKRKNGEEFPAKIMTKPLFDESGHYEKVVGAVRDITERRENEAELNRLAAAVNQAAESILITDVQGLIEYANPAFEKISGYDRVEILERDIVTLSGKKHNKIFSDAVRESLQQGKTWKGNLTKIKKDGGSYEVEATLSPIRDAQGTIINLVGVERDVTHELQLEKQLRQAQKMEAIGTLAGGIAHDFNNILTAIMGYTEICLYKESEVTRIRRDLEQVLKASHRAIDLVNQILTFSRQTEQEKNPIQPEIIIKEALKLLRASLPSTIELHQNIQNDGGRVLADPTQLHQVIMNLCTNAAQAMALTGGVLEVGLEEIKLGFLKRPDSINLKPGNYLKLTISDTGVGIDPAVKERIFDPFFTTKKPGEGTGLGLSVVHGIVKGLEGEISVDSKPGNGSTFQVFFPRINNTATEEIKGFPDLRTGKERILLIDDEEAIVDMGQQMLEQLGYRVTAKTNAKEALELFEDLPSEFDLIITDLTMPYLTGLKLTEKFLKIRPEIPIILCTGFSAGLNLEQVRSIGIKELVMKPIVRSEIAQVIRKVLETDRQAVREDTGRLLNREPVISRQCLNGKEDESFLH
ncbi:MAG: PAS domain S-box protein [Deltaproteobacteria bacterium]|nr:PAS domain S-box protein [Deltaproteobacteria bacterium]